MLEKLLVHLGLEIDSDRLRCIEKHTEGQFHRAKHQEKNPFTEELSEELDNTIMVVDFLLRENTGRGLPLHKYEYFRSNASFIHKVQISS